MTPQFHIAVADQGLIKDLERLLSETKAEVERLRAALILAEDVLSRSPFSNHMWPNGMHPQVGMEQIRAALEDKP